MNRTPSHISITTAVAPAVPQFSHGSQSQSQPHDITSPLSVAPSVPASESASSSSSSHSVPHSLTTSDEVAALMALRDLKEASATTPPVKTLYYPEPPTPLKHTAQSPHGTPPKPYKRQFSDNSIRMVMQRSQAIMGTQDIVSARFEESHRRNEVVTVALPTKRKRDDGDNGSEEANTTVQPLPKVPKPAPRKKKPSDGISRCSKCERQAYTPGNALVACSRCDELWHQLCHSPEIGHETAAAPIGWKCSLCLKEEDDMARYRAARQELLASTRRQTDVNALRNKYLRSLPLGVSIRTPELVGFGPGQSGDDLRFDYFSSLDRSDQLALLGFCDKLQPNLLAEMLTAISMRHPELALYGSPDWASLVSESLPGASVSPLSGSHRPAMSTGRSKSHTPSRKHMVNTVALPQSTDAKAYVPRLAMESLRKRESPVKAAAAVQAKPALTLPALEPSKSATPEDEVDALPPTWPRAGAGAYANILSETVSSKHLADAHDTIAFHHFTINQQGRLLPKMAVAALV